MEISKTEEICGPKPDDFIPVDVSGNNYIFENNPDFNKINLTDFFGRKVKTQTGFLKIARKYNLKIIPMRNIRLPDNTLQITFEEPLDHSNDNISDDKKMLEINAIVERWIRESPENWFWQHKRFN